MKKENTINIFVVDDDKLLSLTLENVISKAFIEYDVVISKFETVEDALLKMQERNPDIVILDYNLNANKLAMNGIDVLQKIKLFNNAIQVVMLSGQDNLEIAVQSIKFGAHDYVIKNESAFVRITQIIKNRIENINLKKSLKKYTVWNWTILILFVSILLIELVSFIYMNYK